MAAPRTRRLPKLSEIQARWNSFRSACDLLPHEIDSSAKASISILRQSGHCVEITSDTLQRENSTFEIIIWSLVVYVILIIFWVLIFSGIAVYLFFCFCRLLMLWEFCLLGCWGRDIVVGHLV